MEKVDTDFHHPMLPGHFCYVTTYRSSLWVGSEDQAAQVRRKSRWELEPKVTGLCPTAWW